MLLVTLPQARPRDAWPIIEPPEISFDGNTKPRHEIIHDPTNDAMSDLYDEYAPIPPILMEVTMLIQFRNADSVTSSAMRSSLTRKTRSPRMAQMLMSIMMRTPRRSQTKAMTSN